MQDEKIKHIDINLYTFFTLINRSKVPIIVNSPERLVIIKHIKISFILNNIKKALE